MIPGDFDIQLVLFLSGSPALLCWPYWHWLPTLRCTASKASFSLMRFRDHEGAVSCFSCKKSLPLSISLAYSSRTNCIRISAAALRFWIFVSLRQAFASLM